MRKVMSMLLVVTLLFSMTSMVVFAEDEVITVHEDEEIVTYASHTNSNGMVCNSTSSTLYDISLVNVYSRGSHTANGYPCYISEQLWNHKRVCSCGKELGTGTSICTVVHSRCGTNIVNH